MTITSLPSLAPLAVLSVLAAWAATPSWAADNAPRTRIHDATREVEHVERKVFCDKASEKAAGAKCQAWLDAQKKSLGARLMTSHCGDGELTADASCLYRAEGEVKYVTSEKSTIYTE